MTYIKPHLTCGTPAAYQQHYRLKEQICEPCRVAWNEYAKMSRAVKQWNSPTARLQRYLRGDLG